ncbi:MAG TPA: hypothetical protein VGQ81_11185 [Acidobacteriota bacterium]|nr:hypothetical protein [Acidobacteriota bacterium]
MKKRILSVVAGQVPFSWVSVSSTRLSFSATKEVLENNDARELPTADHVHVHEHVNVHGIRPRESGRIIDSSRERGRAR